MKRKILSVLAVFIAVIITATALTACNKTPAGAESSGGSSESERSESFAERAKELTAQIHGNAVWLEDSAAAYEANRNALWNTPIETNGAVIRCNSEEVFVYDAESGKNIECRLDHLFVFDTYLGVKRFFRIADTARRDKKSANECGSEPFIRENGQIRVFGKRNFFGNNTENILSAFKNKSFPPAAFSDTGRTVNTADLAKKQTKTIHRMFVFRHEQYSAFIKTVAGI